CWFESSPRSQSRPSMRTASFFARGSYVVSGVRDRRPGKDRPGRNGPAACAGEATEEIAALAWKYGFRNVSAEAEVLKDRLQQAARRQEQHHDRTWRGEHGIVSAGGVVQGCRRVQAAAEGAGSGVAGGGGDPPGA